MRAGLRAGPSAGPHPRPDRQRGPFRGRPGGRNSRGLRYGDAAGIQLAARALRVGRRYRAGALRRDPRRAPSLVGGGALSGIAAASLAGRSGASRGVVLAPRTFTPPAASHDPPTMSASPRTDATVIVSSSRTP